jgi:hypothetical protein
MSFCSANGNRTRQQRSWPFLRATEEYGIIRVFVTPQSYPMRSKTVLFSPFSYMLVTEAGQRIHRVDNFLLAFNYEHPGGLGYVDSLKRPEVVKGAPHCVKRVQRVVNDML